MSEILPARRLTNRIDLNLLELFAATYRVRNMTLAGAELGLSQPAMSRSLARLRSAYRDPLFVRAQHGLEPTPFADGLYDSACAVLEIVQRSLDTAVFVPSEAQRSFRIAMSDTAEQTFLPRLAKRLMAQAPGLRLQTEQSDSAELAGALAVGKIDLAIGFFQLPPEGLHRQHLFDARYACVARRDHPEIGERLTLAHYRRLGHVMTGFPATAHAMAVQRFLEAPQVSATIALRLGSFLSIGPIVAATDYIATIPRNLALSFQNAWGVRMYEPPLKLPVYDVSQYWHERFHREPGLIWLRSQVKALFGSPALNLP